VPGDVCVGVTGTHTPFCSISLVGQLPAVKGEDEDVVGTQTPFCSIALVPQTPFVVVEDVVGTQTPFCSIALVPQTLDELEVPKF